MGLRTLAAAVFLAAALSTFRPRRRSGVRLTWWLAVRESDVPPPTTGCNRTLRHPERGADVATTITTTQEVEFKIEPKDRKGHKAPVDGVPEWLTNNSDVVHLHPAADGLSCRVVANGIPGQAQVQVTVDAKVGEGTESLVGTAAVVVVPAPATNIELAEGEVKESDDDGSDTSPPVVPPTPPVSPPPPTVPPVAPPTPPTPTDPTVPPVVPPSGGQSNPAPATGGHQTI